MANEIRIIAGEVQLSATLNDSDIAKNVYDALPIESTVNRWGEEIYFPIPIKGKLGPDARDVVEVGEIGYWPPGKAFCIFFGPTPASQGDEPRAASPVNIIGKVRGDARVCSGVADGETIRIEKASGD